MGDPEFHETSSTPSCRLICPSTSQQLAVSNRERSSRNWMNFSIASKRRCIVQRKTKSRRSYVSLRRCPNSLAAPSTSDEMSEQQRPRNTDTVFQIKVTLMGIVPLIWRRIQTQDCTLVEFHDLLQVTMGWEFEHLYRFIIGGVKYADLDMTSQEDAQDACETNFSEILPAQNRRPRFHYEYDLGINGCIS